MAVTGDETKTGASGDSVDWKLPGSSKTAPQAGSVAGGHGFDFSVPVADAAQKRALRRMKNKKAAKECRQRKKEYVRCLEKRLVMLENQNKTLIEELRALRNVCRVKVE